MKFSFVSIDRQKNIHLSVKTAEWFFERILSDTKSGSVARYREQIALFGSTGLKERNLSLAQVCPAVEMVKQANGNMEVVHFNGLVTLHVANLLRAKDIELVKEASKMLPMTMAAFTGADGRSAEILVAVASKEAQKDFSTEQEMNIFSQMAYESACSVYRGVLPFSVERQLVTARSSFMMTLDENPYYNANATPLLIGRSSGGDAYGNDPHEDCAGSATWREQREIDMDLYAVYEQMYQAAASEAYEATADIVESQRLEAYLSVLCAKLCERGVPEEEAFLHIRNHYHYKEEYDEDVFRAIAAAVYAESDHRRQSDEPTVSQETRRLIGFLRSHYVFRYNTVLGYTEYRPNNTWVHDWMPCDENVINGMTIEARLANLDARDKDVRRYVRSNMIRRCDPIDDFFAKVSGKWDGKTDHIAMLARCISCDIPQWEKWFRKWFLSMVAQWIKPYQEYGNSIVPLLISAQGDGKTSFCRMILPKELSWGFLENLNVGDKRATLQAMHSFLLINLDEFNQIGQKLQEGFLKNVIQLPSVKIKRPYGKHVEEFKRYASFIATTNETNVLSDPTGNRRFICVQLTAPVNTAYKPNYEALYGQAYALVMGNKEQWWFSPEEVKEIVAHNREFEMIPPAILYFKEYYEPADDEKGGVWLSPTAIYDRLRRIAGSDLKAGGVSSFGRYISNIPGLKQKRLSYGRLYLVREKK